MGWQRCGGFTYEVYAPPGDMTPHVYEFLSPGWLTFVRPGGRIETLNYGLAERVEILQCSLRYASNSNTQLDTIPCPDGSMIVNWDPDLHMRMLSGGTETWVNRDDRMYALS